MSDVVYLATYAPCCNQLRLGDWTNRESSMHCSLCRTHSERQTVLLSAGASGGTEGDPQP